MLLLCRPRRSCLPSQPTWLRSCRIVAEWKCDALIFMTAVRIMLGRIVKTGNVKSGYNVLY